MKSCLTVAKRYDIKVFTCLTHVFLRNFLSNILCFCIEFQQQHKKCCKRESDKSCCKVSSQNKCCLQGNFYVLHASFGKNSHDVRTARAGTHWVQLNFLRAFLI